MANRPLVSVVTPFYNTAPYLAECIESVLGQSYPAFEYILADNCSTDGSSEIAEGYALPRIADTPDSVPRVCFSAQKLQSAPSAEISDVSKYSKIVQADDFHFSRVPRIDGANI